MNCDICGKSGKLFKVELEGSKVIACENCARYGKVFHEVKQETPNKIKLKEAKEKERDAASKAPKTPETVQLIVKDYASRIKNAREKKGMKQEDFAKKISEKESLLHQLESGKMEPSIALAQKLEKFLGIKLVEEVILESEEKKEGLKPHNGPMTLGDLINIKRR